MELYYAKESLLYSGNSIEDAYRTSGVPSYGNEVLVDFQKAKEYASLIHPKQHITNLEFICDRSGFVAELPASPKLFSAALASVFVAIKAADTYGFGVTRPPGHHASKGRASGFCLFNNIAIATQYLLNQDKRVCVVDIDGHHGNGTAKIFAGDDNVLMFSLAQASAFPYKRINSRKVLTTDLPAGSSEESVCTAVIDFIPYIRRFNPDVLAISAGFDAHKDDALLNLNVTTQGYGRIGSLLGELNIPSFALLEGGYSDSVLDSILAFVEGFERKSS